MPKPYSQDLRDRVIDVVENTNGRSSARRDMRAMPWDMRAMPWDMRAMPSANASASGSRRPSAGSRLSPTRSEQSSAVASASGGPLEPGQERRALQATLPMLFVQATDPKTGEMTFDFGGPKL